MPKTPAPKLRMVEGIESLQEKLGILKERLIAATERDIELSHIFSEAEKDYNKRAAKEIFLPRREGEDLDLLRKEKEENFRELNRMRVITKRLIQSVKEV